ncbi:MAG: alpha-1,4-digalacturonate transport system permease protein [Pseudorhodobacter sp.]|jgi:alpha-1,4-digalacturonate transport system permease protein
MGAVAMAPLAWLAGLLDRPLRLWQRWTGQSGMVAFFLIPNMAVFGIFVLLPLVINLAYSTTSGSALFLTDRTYVGADQYAQLLSCTDYSDPASCDEDHFWRALSNTALFAFLQVTLMIIAATITALILNRNLWGRSFWRAMFFFPVLLSPVVVGLIWRWILQRDGLLNAFMLEMGAEPINWLIERNWAFAATIGVTIWAHLGFYALILLAGLQTIPRDLYEAAEMDGTPAGRVFWRITLPLLMPNLLVVIVLSLIRAVQVFDEAFVLTGGGPGTATLFLTQYIYEVGFASLLKNPGLASAASILMGSILVVLTLIQLAIGRRNENKAKLK